MATSITGAERLPDGDYSVPHRAPPPIPSDAPPVSSAPPPQLLNDPGRPPDVSESGSVRSKYSERRRGSFASLLRRASSHNSQAQQQNGSGSNNSDTIPPVPSIAQAHQQAAVASGSGRDSTSTFSSRKISGEGRTMLRKSSKMRAAQEKERLEQERISRATAPPPRLPSHNPLPGIDSFGGENNHSNAHTTANFSRPGNNNNNNANSSYNMPSSGYNSSSSPAYATRGTPPVSSPPSKSNGEYVDAVERHESMTHRGRYSYASSTVPVNVSSPRRIRRRKDPTPFNVLVVGAKNSGKTSFISFLRHSLAIPSHRHPSTESSSTANAPKSPFSSHYLETEMDGERVGLTLWDSAGLEKNIVDLQLREMVTFVESKFEETFVEEQKVMRSPGVKDTNIHCVFLVLDPASLDSTIAASSTQRGGGLNLASVSGLDDELDLSVIRALWGKTTVIPVISKADTLTMGHMSFLKRAVWQSIKGAKMDPLEALELEDDLDEVDEEGDSDSSSHHSNRDDEETEDSDVVNNLADRDYSSSSSDQPAHSKNKKTHNRHSSLTIKSTPADDETPYIPMSILSPDPYDLPPYVSKPKSDKIGRRFPWGLADPYNAEHCDFTRLRDSIFSEWKSELRDLSRSKWYENWRTTRLKNLPGSGRERIKGGVTPTSTIPKAGRRFSGTNGGMNVPRSVSASTQEVEARPSKIERMMGVGAEEAAARNGTYH